jgi:hypothetical protein
MIDESLEGMSSTVIYPYTCTTLIMRADVINFSRSSISFDPSAPPTIPPIQRTEIDLLINTVVLTEFSISQTPNY